MDPTAAQRAADPILVTGASGYIGGHLVRELVRRGHDVRVLARDPRPGAFPPGVGVRRGDAVAGTGLDEALAGCRTLYYLIHSMGRGSGSVDGFAARDRTAAERVGAAAAQAGVERVIYLGGLGPTGPGASAHLRSRHEVAEILGDATTGVVEARAAMIIGPGSASYEMVRALVERLPVMVAPRWIDTRSQPIALADVVRALADLARTDTAPAEVQLGGADVLTYRELMNGFADVTGRRRPLILRVPVLSPRLSSYWVALVTPVELGLVRPLVDGLRSEMVVERAPPPGLNDAPLGFADAVRAARPRHASRVDLVAEETAIDGSGAVRSTQVADVTLPAAHLDALWSPVFLERLARTYWRHLSRVSLGLVRVAYTDGERAVVLVRPPLALLRFRAPEYTVDATRGVVRWRIRDGILVDAPGRDADGYLELAVERAAPAADGAPRVRVAVEVANFYPRVATWLTRRVYVHTQSRIHVVVTQGFLRSLARRELEPSAVGRFAGEAADPGLREVTVGETPRLAVVALAGALAGLVALALRRRR